MIASRVAKTRAIQTRELEIAKSARSWWLSRPEQHALQTDMSEVTSASPAAKRARLAESRASNVLALQTYRIRVTLPLAMGKQLVPHLFGNTMTLCTGVACHIDIDKMLAKT